MRPGGSPHSAEITGNRDLSMRSQRDLTGLIKFLARNDWKSRFEEVMGEHLAPAMLAFDVKYQEIGAVLGGGWDMTAPSSWPRAGLVGAGLVG